MHIQLEDTLYKILSFACVDLLSKCFDPWYAKLIYGARSSILQRQDQDSAVSLNVVKEAQSLSAYSFMMSALGSPVGLVKIAFPDTILASFLLCLQILLALLSDDACVALLSGLRSCCYQKGEAHCDLLLLFQHSLFPCGEQELDCSTRRPAWQIEGKSRLCQSCHSLASGSKCNSVRQDCKMVKSIAGMHEWLVQEVVKYYMSHWHLACEGSHRGGGFMRFGHADASTEFERSSAGALKWTIAAQLCHRRQCISSVEDDITLQ